MLGKKQVSQLSLFDYVIGISIGNFAAEMTINLESNEINGIWAVVLFGFFSYFCVALYMGYPVYSVFAFKIILYFCILQQMQIT